MRAPTENETAVLDALVAVARPIILSEFRADSCIASCRLAIDTLAYFGITGVEKAVTALVVNKEAATLLNNGMTMTDLGTLLNTLSSEQPGGPWTIGIGVGTGKVGAWAGHLIVTLPEIHGVLDLSIDQGSRPHKNIHLEPYWGVLDDDGWWSEDEDSSPLYPIASPDGTLVMLDRRATDPTGYLTSPNWKRKGVVGQGTYRTLTGRLIREVKALLD